MRPRVAFLLLSGALATLACAPAPPPAEEEVAEAGPCEGLNTLSDAEQADGWKLLFDGESLAGWHGYNGKTTESWSIDDCSIKSAGTEDNYGSDLRADLVTDEEFANFELVFDWKATTAGNSGVMYAVVEDPKYEAAWHTGPEYQLLDDVDFPEELKPSQYTGSDYEMIAAPEDKGLKPVGEWNTTKLVVDGPHVEHWLNGQKLFEFERWTDEWKARRDAGKWSEYEDYGMAEAGRIVFQDHGSEFWFRNMKIRELEDDEDEMEEEE